MISQSLVEQPTPLEMRFQRCHLVLPMTTLLLFACNVRSNEAFGANLLTRESDASELVDPVTIPACVFNTCWEYNAPPPAICPLVDGPCPNNSQASDNGGDECGMKQYSRECYCNLKTGLSCAWSCTWDSWWDAEDWFAKLCPNSPALKLDFSGLPKCARGCLDDAIFEYGCLTQSSNCFCTHGDLFECQNKCTKDSEWSQMVIWLQNACDITADNAKLALEQGYFYVQETSEASSKDVHPPSPPPRKPLAWDEIFIMVVLAFTAVAGLGLWGISCVSSKRKRLSSLQGYSAVAGSQPESQQSAW